MGTDGGGAKGLTSFGNGRTEKHPDRAMGQLLSDAVVEADPRGSLVAKNRRYAPIFCASLPPGSATSSEHYHTAQG